MSIKCKCTRFLLLATRLFTFFLGKITNHSSFSLFNQFGQLKKKKKLFGASREVCQSVNLKVSSLQTASNN